MQLLRNYGLSDGVFYCRREREADFQVTDTLQVCVSAGEIAETKEREIRSEADSEKAVTAGTGRIIARGEENMAYGRRRG